MPTLCKQETGASRLLHPSAQGPGFISWGASQEGHSRWKWVDKLTIKDQQVIDTVLIESLFNLCEILDVGCNLQLNMINFHADASLHNIAEELSHIIYSVLRDMSKSFALMKFSYTIHVT